MVKVRKDLTGEVFGKLTVLKQTNDYINPSNGLHIAQWLCRCSCEEHTLIVVRGNDLKTGHTTSCGCKKKRDNTNMTRVKDDLTGKTFGRLTVLYQVEDNITPQGTYEAQWLCECSCDQHTQIIVRNVNLKSGHTNSCGCLRKDKASELHKKYNRYDLTGEYGIGWTNNTDNEFYFDLGDYDLIKDYCWSERVGRYHALLTTINGKKVKMHQLFGMSWYDHEDRNPLNNRRKNLRPSSNQENSRNHSKRKDNTTGFSGVYWRKDVQKWTAMIVINRCMQHLGYFNDKEEAIKTRLKAEYEHYGPQFAPQRHLFEEYGIETTQND